MPKIFEIGGPKNYSFKELMEILLTQIKKKRFLVGTFHAMCRRVPAGNPKIILSVLSTEAKIHL